MSKLTEKREAYEHGRSVTTKRGYATVEELAAAIYVTEHERKAFIAGWRGEILQ